MQCRVCAWHSLAPVIMGSGSASGGLKVSNIIACPRQWGILGIRGRTIEVAIGERGNGERLWIETEKNRDKKMVRETVAKVEEIGVKAKMSCDGKQCL